MLLLAVAAGCASANKEGEAACGVAVLTSATDLGVALRAANEALDESIAPRRIVARAVERARKDTSAEPTFKGAATPDPAIEAAPWDKDDFKIVTTYQVVPDEVNRKMWFALASKPLETYCELHVTIRPLAHEGQAAVGAIISVLYSFPREEKDRTWGIRFWRALYAEVRAATMRGLRTLGEVQEAMPPTGRERD
jgi:hypothetical protein